MTPIDRRAFITAAAAIGASLAWSGRARASTLPWHERRDLYPDGVASGDPEPDSVILWTRRPFDTGDRAALTVEIALDPAFRRVVSTAHAPVLAAADWTCRVLAAGLKPATIYWYRFVDETGAGSRIGRTITAPRDADPATVRFAFVSCQSVNEGKQNAYRRMIWEDERAPADKQLSFVLHLGDFIYEIVEYPDEVAHRYDRTIYDIGKVPDGRKIGNFHAPTNVAGYRMVYRAHIADPDIQDARARWPFVCIGDNHEFSWQGWQSFIQYNGKAEPAQKLRVAANQAWWEYIPSRVAKASGAGLAAFDPPSVVDAPIDKLDAHGLGDEPNNLTALASMTAYRAVRYGRHVDLIITDLHSYTMQDPTARAEADAFALPDFPFMMPQEVLEVLDAGRGYADGHPPAEIAVGATTAANFRKDEPVYTVLGSVQKEWFKRRLAVSTATWKIWAATNGTLDIRMDPQNLPAGLTKPWPGKGYATFGGGDFSAALTERAEIYDLVRDAGIAGFVTVSGDRHSFWAGYAAKALPPEKFEPVGVTFIGGSISAAGMAEALEHGLKKSPIRAIYTVDRPGEPAEATINMSIKRGVASALEYARSGDLNRAHALTNPDVSPHLEFVDMGGHGYSVVTAGADAIETEFVCIPRPIARATTPDGGPLRYRVAHRAVRWAAGARPVLTQHVIEGDPRTSV
ncbi:MAG: alkaline phosphatase D family protein [Pseudomonadota bacterium]|nr:alkaline phosphatase D family protein [Pseudomonadota bacterium]